MPAVLQSLAVVWTNREKPCTAVKYFLSGMPQLRTLRVLDSTCGILVEVGGIEGDVA